MSAVSLLHPIKEKNPCDRYKVVKKNPDDINKAIDKYREFHHGLEPDKLKKLKQKQPSSLFVLGKVDRIDYTREEPEGKRAYYHNFGEESGKRPTLASSPDGNKLYIFGGNFKVEDWIYD